MDNSPFLFAMTSEWMENGNINEFIEAHQNANRFELVGFTPIVDDITPHIHFLVAQRRRQGVNIYARSSDDTRRLEGGMALNACRYSAI